MAWSDFARASLRRPCAPRSRAAGQIAAQREGVRCPMRQSRPASTPRGSIVDRSRRATAYVARWRSRQYEDHAEEHARTVDTTHDGLHRSGPAGLRDVARPARSVNMTTATSQTIRALHGDGGEADGCERLQVGRFDDRQRQVRRRSRARHLSLDLVLEPLDAPGTPIVTSFTRMDPRPPTWLPRRLQPFARAIVRGELTVVSSASAGRARLVRSGAESEPRRHDAGTRARRRLRAAGRRIRGRRTVTSTPRLGPATSRAGASSAHEVA